MPDGVQVVLGFGNGDLFNENAVKVHECGNAHVGGTMNENGTTIESVHDSTENAEILRGRSPEIHRNVDISHPEPGYEAAFVRDRVVGGRKSEIDDGCETSFADLAELLLGGLAGSGQFVAEGAEVVNFRERC